MNYRGLDMNLLVVLDALLEDKNITRASHRIYLSQSGASEALARLREFFRDDILVQVGNRMVLTPLAETLVQPVRETLRSTRSIIDSRLEFTPAKSNRRFRVMMSDYMITVLMPKILQRMETVAPKIELDILPLTEKSAEWLDRTEIDLLIMPGQFLTPAHPCKDLLADTHTCMVWSENQEYGEALSLEEYFSATHLAAYYYDRKSSALDRWLFTHYNQKRNVLHISRAQGLLPQLVVGTHHIATMQQRLAETYAGSLPLRIVTPRFDMPVLVEAVQWHSTREEDSGILWLRDLFCDAAQKDLAGNRISSCETKNPLVSPEFSLFLRKELS